MAFGAVKVEAGEPDPVGGGSAVRGDLYPSHAARIADANRISTVCTIPF